MHKKVDYWLKTADDDVITARVMLEAARLLWMGFICHLIAEKALKAVIANNTGEMPPKIHNLLKLADISGVATDLSAEQKQLLKELMPLHIEARYTEYKQQIAEMLTIDYCKRLMKETEEFLCWIKTRLAK